MRLNKLDTAAIVLSVLAIAVLALMIAAHIL